MVLADESRLRQIFVNLLSNALKYSSAGSPLEVMASGVSAGARPWAGGSTLTSDGAVPVQEVCISVRDYGLGVPPKEAARLFRRFVRLQRDIAGSVRGTGVGLYLCQQFVQAMGGRIWLESSGVPGEGSTFSFTLPVAQPTQVEPPADVQSR
jgi:signal transduction histidine kinase